MKACTRRDIVVSVITALFVLFFALDMTVFDFSVKVEIPVIAVGFFFYGVLTTIAIHERLQKRATAKAATKTAESALTFAIVTMLSLQPIQARQKFTVVEGCIVVGISALVIGSIYVVYKCAKNATKGPTTPPPGPPPPLTTTNWSGTNWTWCPNCIPSTWLPGTNYHWWPSNYFGGGGQLAVEWRLVQNKPHGWFSHKEMPQAPVSSNSLPITAATTVICTNGAMDTAASPPTPFLTETTIPLWIEGSTDLAHWAPYVLHSWESTNGLLNQITWSNLTVNIFYQANSDPLPDQLDGEIPTPFGLDQFYLRSRR
jgi:hypothetical protein